MEKVTNDIAQDEHYLVIGSNYYKRCRRPQLDGGGADVLLPWKKRAIKEDSNKKNYLEGIPRYKGFITYPSHTDYKESIDGWFNLYQPIPAQPKEGNIDKTMEFLSHIFGEQLPLGLDYLQLLYLEPLDLLPVLVLLTEKRNTANGKTTFLQFLRFLFGDNIVYCKQDKLWKGRYCKEWTDKLLIQIDDIMERNRDITQAARQLFGHSEIGKVGSKHCFGKFILCTQEGFIRHTYRAQGEDRFWYVKPSSIINPRMQEELLDELKQEVPAFLYFLLHRTLTTKKEGRWWFNKKLYMNA